MDARPRLSIITPVYNGETFVSGCVECVVAQNCAGIEHIVVDGGSTDRTVEILREKPRRILIFGGYRNTTVGNPMR